MDRICRCPVHSSKLMYICDGHRVRSNHLLLMWHCGRSIGIANLTCRAVMAAISAPLLGVDTFPKTIVRLCWEGICSENSERIIHDDPLPNLDLYWSGQLPDVSWATRRTWNSPQSDAW